MSDYNCPLRPRQIPRFEDYIAQVFPQLPDSLFDPEDIVHWITEGSFKLFGSYHPKDEHGNYGKFVHVVGDPNVVRHASGEELAAYRYFMLPSWLRRLSYFSYDDMYRWLSPRHFTAYLEYVYPFQSKEERQAGGIPLEKGLLDIASNRLDGCIRIVHNTNYDHNATSPGTDEVNTYSFTRSMRQRFFLPECKLSRPLIVPIEITGANGQPNFVRDLCTFPNFWLFLNLYFNDATIHQHHHDHHSQNHHYHHRREPGAIQSFLQFYRSHQTAYVVPSNSRFAFDNMVYLCRAASEAEFYDPYLRNVLVLKDPPYPAEYQDPGVYERHDLIRGIFALAERQEREKRDAARHNH